MCPHTPIYVSSYSYICVLIVQAAGAGGVGYIGGGGGHALGGGGVEDKMRWHDRVMRYYTAHQQKKNKKNGFDRRVAFGLSIQKRGSSSL